MKKNRLSYFFTSCALTFSCLVANANNIKTEFIYVEPYLGSIRDVYPSITIRNYRVDYIAYDETALGNGYGKAMHILLSGKSNERKDNLIKMCRELEGKYEKVVYGFDNISASQKQVTDIKVDQRGTTHYTTGQTVHVLFNMYCGTI